MMKLMQIEKFDWSIFMDTRQCSNGGDRILVEAVWLTRNQKEKNGESQNKIGICGFGHLIFVSETF